MMTEGLIIKNTVGKSPLNVHGTMNGFPFYMRATQHGWTLTVVPTEQDAFEAWISAHMDGHELGIYHDAELHDCKKLTWKYVEAFLEGAYEKFCQILSDDKERTGALSSPCQSNDCDPMSGTVPLHTAEKVPDLNNGGITTWMKNTWPQSKN